ncbi:threonine dehydratase [Chelatococcus sp. SYSU_G07232]|uniref:Threonine dehydratase n=1 Tax=Chelatococcus albus TaxID=3047466 RepID=A0ABT7ALJ3_9HYPH|nr:threonine dehydratase [Chelatococcus sp. SYSU_G07232]MDJ1159940.1 threonine dehydratase [Chelatococcus sp. SYSU_G07232]
MFDRDDLDRATEVVHRVMPPTPQYAWPLLRERFGVDVVVKHENHTPTGAFKVRGGLVYLDRLKRERPTVRGVVSATRGNHGQSLAFAGRRFGVPVAIVVPHGNSGEKNAAMRAFGADLIEHGADFDEAKPRAAALAEERGYEFVPSFHRDLVTGVATYALELFTAHPDLDVVYAPIGLGSGICGLIRTRDLLGLRTEIVGVVAQGANAYRLSVEAGAVEPTARAATFADGMAVRVPDPQALAMISAGAARIVEVTEHEIADAIRAYHEDTHNLAEGAGAAALAALAGERRALSGRKACAVLSGGNIDRGWAATVLSGGIPVPA